MPAAIPIAIGALVAGTAANIVQGQQQRRAQKAALAQAQAAANAPGPQQVKSPGRRMPGMAPGGMPGDSTLLTGPSGVDAGSASLGKNTLLGG